MNRKLLWVLVAAGCSLGVVACGDDDDSADEGPSTTTTVDATPTDWAIVSRHLFDDMSTQVPGLTEAEASADDGSMLELHFAVSQAAENPAELAFLAVEDIQQRHAAALDGIRDVKVHVKGPGEEDETEETYPYTEVRSWIETGAIGTGAVTTSSP